jgi:hypothetical protein
MNYLPRLALNHNLLISASQVARIIGVSHWHPARAVLRKWLKAMGYTWPSNSTPRHVSKRNESRAHKTWTQMLMAALFVSIKQ